MSKHLLFLSDLYSLKFKDNSSKTSGNEKRVINTKSKKTTVKDGPKNYIDKTRELNRLRYFMNLKLESCFLPTVRLLTRLLALQLTYMVLVA